MSDKRKITSSSLARMAGNIAAGFVSLYRVDNAPKDEIADVSVEIAYRILLLIEKREREYAQANSEAAKERPEDAQG